jgi:hypothetical protein
MSSRGEAGAVDEQAEGVRQQWQRRAPGLARPFEDFSELRWRAFLARAMLVTTVGVTVLGALFEAMHIGVLSDRPVSPIALATSDGRIAAAYIAQAIAYVLCAVAFIAWMHRARINTEALGDRSQRYGAGWAVGGWFVPILNLWRPKQVIDDIWVSSDAAGTPDGAPRRPIPMSFHGWWFCWIASLFAERASIQAYDVSRPYPQQQVATVMALVTSAITVVAALLAIRVVARITDLQRERATERAALAGLSAPAEAAAP